MKALQAPIYAVARVRKSPKGFTLVEILIVVVILGILAAIVIPQFSNASHTARESTLKDDLRYLRTQIGVYRAQHRDVSPGAGSADFMTQMTMYTDDEGVSSVSPTTTAIFGPYLSKMPSNPLSGKSTIKISTAADLTTAIDDTTGWIYNADNQQIIANQSGADDNGTSYSQY